MCWVRCHWVGMFTPGLWGQTIDITLKSEEIKFRRRIPLSKWPNAYSSNMFSRDFITNKRDIFSLTVSNLEPRWMNHLPPPSQALQGCLVLESYTWLEGKRDLHPKQYFLIIHLLMGVINICIHQLHFPKKAPVVWQLWWALETKLGLKEKPLIQEMSTLSYFETQSALTAHPQQNLGNSFLATYI